jgi:hypothetical protein
VTERGPLPAPVSYQDIYLHDIARSLRELAAALAQTKPAPDEGLMELREPAPAKPKPRTRDDLQAQELEPLSLVEVEPASKPRAKGKGGAG